MNIALPALLILCFLLSGYIYISALDRAENTTLDRKPFEASSAGAVFTALLYNSIFIFMVNLFIPVDFNLCVKIITGTKLDDRDVITITSSVHNIAAFFITNYALAHILGKISQRILFNCNPYKSSSLAFDTPWYYELKGKLSTEKDAQIIKLSCLQDLKGGSYLYYGILEDFYLDKHGQLERIVLSDVSRRVIENDDVELISLDACLNEAKNKSTPESRFYEVKGDRFILKYQNLSNINIEYLYLTEVTDEASD